MDGFVPRQASSEMGKQHNEAAKLDRRRHRIHAGQLEVKNLDEARPVDSTMGVTSIQESLAAIDENDTEQAPQTRRERRRLRKEQRKHPKRRRVIKRIIIFLVVALLAVGAYVGIKAFIASSNIFQGGLFGFAQRQPLKQDANGRSNVLIFGTSEDSPDHDANGGEGGPLLTDSIMVLSVDQEKKDAYMISIPRDLWVRFDEPCSVGYQEKINSVYQCGSDFGENPEAGAQALQKKVGEILGLDIQYYGQVDYSVVEQAVDAVGGIDVKIESNPPGAGILDRNFDWKCNYQCHYVQYDDGEVAHLDGEHALALARARNAQGGHGLVAGNFDREKNQQKIINALREKALNVGTLTNLGKVTGLIDAFGSSLKTNVNTSEVQTIMALAGELQGDSIKPLTLVDEDSPLVTTGSVGAASAVYPVAGMFDYSEIKVYIARNSSSDPLVREGAKVAVFNGTTITGLAQQEADKLTDAGYFVSLVGNAPDGTYQDFEVYKVSEGNSATALALAERYGIELKTTPPPLSVASDIAFVVLIGAEPAD